MEQIAEGIRLFVSSTFKDMQSERDQLVKRIFPQLRRLCEDRGRSWSEVDLRWGVTDEESTEGRAIAICFEEIDRCRPFFIALLGDRYGWVPPTLPAEFASEHPWISGFQDRSVTELEIRHAALNDPAAAGHTFFYLRTLCAPLRESEPEDRRAKLARLKEEIRGSGLPVREFPDEQALGALVLQDFRGLIDRLYPEREIPDPLWRERQLHLDFARRHSRVYVGGERYLEHLDRHVRAKTPPLVVTGEPGSGKSALLSTWVTRLIGSPSVTSSTESALSWLISRWRKPTAPAPEILAHFSGVDAAVDSWSALARNILRQLSGRLGLGLEVPGGKEALRGALVEGLHRAAARTRVVLVLDGLDQIVGTASPLDWLPRNLPPKIRLILSTTPGALSTEATARGWGGLEISPLGPEDRGELIRTTLEIYRKKLAPEYLDLLRNSPQAANPLFLHILLEELRVFGHHEALGSRIARYLTALDTPALYSQVLERLEGDFDSDRSGLVRELMIFLWAARRGLSEAEARSFLQPGDDPLPGSIWSPLYLALEGALVSHMGVLGFHHRQLRRAVEARYLSGDGARRQARLHLADRFTAEPLSPRKVEELPWQVSKTEAWPRLQAVLTDLPFFEMAWKLAPFEVQSYWTTLHDRTDLRAPEAYREVLKFPEAHRDAARAVAHLLRETGFVGQAASVYRALVDLYRRTVDHNALQESLGNLAMALRTLGDLGSALALLWEQERICRALDDRQGLARCLGNQGVLQVDVGDPRAALYLHCAEEALFHELGDEVGMGRSRGNQARVHFALGDWKRSQEGALFQEKIARDQGDLSSLQAALGNQARALKALKKSRDIQKKLHEEEEKICRSLGDREGLQASLLARANILAHEQNWDGAFELLDEQERICREIPSPSALADGLLSRAAMYENLSQTDLARRLTREAERLRAAISDGRTDAPL